MVAIAPGIHPNQSDVRNGSSDEKGSIAHMAVMKRIGYNTNEAEGEGTSRSMNHGVREDQGKASQIAGIKKRANGVNMQRMIGENISVIFIHQISGRGAASNPSAGRNCTNIMTDTATAATQKPYT